MEPISNDTQTTQEINKINRIISPKKEESSTTNHIYQNIQKEQPREKIGQFHFS